MKKTKLILALVSTGAALGLVSCAQEPPIYIETPEVHNVTVVEKPVVKPRPKVIVRPRVDSSPEGFRAVY